jgi:uncharacterized protein (TIGR02246 family)
MKTTIGILILGVLRTAALWSAPIRGGMVGVTGIDPELSRVADAFAAAVNAGDARAAAAVFAEDGVEMPPDQPAARGRGAIEAYYRQLFSGPVRISNFRLSHADARIAGDLAYLAGTSTLVVTPPGGAPPQTQAGKYVVILRKTAGAWQVVDAIHNADAPCAPATAPR